MRVGAAAIEERDLVAAPDGVLHHVRANEAGPAQNEDRHRGRGLLDGFLVAVACAGAARPQRPRGDGRGLEKVAAVGIARVGGVGIVTADRVGHRITSPRWGLEGWLGQRSGLRRSRRWAVVNVPLVPAPRRRVRRAPCDSDQAEPMVRLGQTDCAHSETFVNVGSVDGDADRHSPRLHHSSIRRLACEFFH